MADPQQRKRGQTVEFHTKNNVPIFENSSGRIDPMHRLILVGEGSGGLCAFLPISKFSFVNPYFSMTVLRPPKSEWVSLRGRTEVDPTLGSGLCTSTMFDDEGLCATISQPQIVECQNTIKRK